MNIKPLHCKHGCTISLDTESFSSLHMYVHAYVANDVKSFNSNNLQLIVAVGMTMFKATTICRT